MIGLNPLRTKVLITTDEVQFHAPTDHQMDPRMTLQSIIIAERRFIKPMIGAVVYDALIAAKNILVTTANMAGLQTDINVGRTGREIITLKAGDYVNSDTYLSVAQLALWQNYLHKITAECVYFTGLPVVRSRMTSQGVMQNDPNTINNNGTSATIDLKDLKHLMDRSLQDRISPLIEDMHQYMCTSGYVGYDKDCGCDSNGVPQSRVKKTDIILGMYDDDEQCGCRKRRDCEWDT